jgi:hypothetical protein
VRMFSKPFFVTMGICGVLAAGVSLFTPWEYRADADVLIVSRSRYGVDPYTVAKSAERIGENIAQVVTTDDFFGKVMSEPNYSVDRSRFENISERVKRRRWGKAVDASVVYGTGVLHFSAYAKTPESAAQLAGASAAALTRYAPEYVGGDVTFKLLNSPVSTRFPARPRILFAFVLGAFFGAGVSLVLQTAFRRKTHESVYRVNG